MTAAGLRALVIVPTYNERENLSSLAAAILAQGEAFHLLVVDDGSPDGTGEIADRLAASDPRVSVLHRRRKSGLGQAYIAGLTRGLSSGFEYLITMDADHSHDPADLPRLLAAVHEGGADVAVGSRWTEGGGTSGWPLFRRVLSRAGSLYARVTLGLSLRDVTGGFRCLRRSALASLDVASIRSSGYGFLIELNYRAALRGFTIVEVPIVFTERAQGTSKMSTRIVLEAVLRVPLLRLTTRRALSRAVPAPVATPPPQPGARRVDLTGRRAGAADQAQPVGVRMAPED
ncbi:MAG TPA: polyprenol monophosphomannose synthase [Candidatus Dormibacteraeota bacterium]|nr:polyprenol monophosphomannose synthase [Candidatus Dormibacteraeota bacterium]